jgi:two-component system chemotaxis response regulator CheV
VTSNELPGSDLLHKFGTHELKVLSFHIGESTFAINIAKVRESISAKQSDLHPMATIQHLAFAGTIRLREGTLPVVDLPKYLEMSKRLTMFFCGDSSLTGFVLAENQLIQILDFERIRADVMGEQRLEVPVGQSEIGSSKRILFAEDRDFVRSSIKVFLEQAGYEVVACSNGEAAWKVFQASHDFEAILIDIEMPLMDGTRLTRLIRIVEMPHTWDTLVASLHTKFINESRSSCKHLNLGMFFCLSR